MGNKKKVEPKSAAAKSTKQGAEDGKATRKSSRKTGRLTWSDAGIKHGVSRLG